LKNKGEFTSVLPVLLVLLLVLFALLVVDNNLNLFARQVLLLHIVLLVIYTDQLAVYPSVLAGHIYQLGYCMSLYFVSLDLILIERYQYNCVVLLGLPYFSPSITILIS